ncbi:hypothetical protein ES703_24338 [subsurface metagenome]
MFEFLGIKDMENDDLVAFVAEMFQAHYDLVRIVEQVGNQDDETSLNDGLGQLVQDGRDFGLRPRLDVGHVSQENLQVAAFGPGSQILAQLGIEKRQADGILLLEHEVSQGRRQGLGVGQLAHAVGSKSHRPALVQQQVALQVGFFFELLDVVAVSFGVQLPVHVADFVARAVGPMFGKLHREAVIGAAVQADDKPLHHQPRPQGEVIQPGDDAGVQVSGAQVSH